MSLSCTKRNLESLMTSPSTLTQPDLRSGAALLASATPEVIEEFLSELSEASLIALPYLFEFWALSHQLPPLGEWRTWIVMGGRGAGKTRAGAEWVRSQVEGATPLAEGGGPSAWLWSERP